MRIPPHIPIPPDQEEYCLEDPYRTDKYYHEDDMEEDE